MTNELNDAIDRAMDAAEAKIDDKEEVIQEAAEVVETPATEDIEETIAVKEAIDNAEKPNTKGRDSSGKFTKAKQPTPITAKASEEKAEETPAEQVSDQVVNDEPTPTDAPDEMSEASQGIDAPAFWSTERKALFAKAPRELQEAIAEGERTLQQHISRATNESQRGKAIEKRASEVFEPYKLKLQAQGIQDPFEATQRLLAWNEIFEKDPKTAIADLMRKNSLTPNDFFEDAQQQQSQYQEQVSPEELRAQAREEAKKEFKAFQEQQEQTRLQSEIETFKNGKDSFGHVRRQFAELHAKPISDAFETILSQYPQMPRTDALNHAYEFVQKEVRAMYGVTAPVTRQADPKPEAVNRAKAAASSVTGAPASGTVAKRPPAKTVDEAMDRAEERLGLR
jgi:hypothetical protein